MAAGLYNTMNAQERRELIRYLMGAKVIHTVRPMVIPAPQLNSKGEYDMPKPEYYYSRLVVAGSDSVDELVRRCDGNYQQAESILHAMIDNYLHFDDMRAERAARLLDSAEKEYSEAKAVMALLATRDAHWHQMETQLQAIKKLEAEVRTRKEEVAVSAPRPGRVSRWATAIQ